MERALPADVPSSPPPAASASATAEPAAPSLAPVAAPAWRRVARQEHGFYVAIDGLCSKLAASPVGEDWIVHYGGEPMTLFLNGERTGVASFIAARGTKFVPIDAPQIDSPTGVAGSSLDSFWVADSTGSRSSEGAVIHRRAAGVWKAYPKDQVDLHPWVDGAVIGRPGMNGLPGEPWVEGSDIKPPPRFTTDLGYIWSMSAFPSGDLLVVGNVGEATTVTARHWSKAKGKRQFRLPGLDSDFAWLVEVAPDEVYAVGTRAIVRWDGTQWRKLGSTTREGIATVKRAAPDELWVVFESGQVERSGPNGFVPELVPEPVADLDGLSFGKPWMVGRSGKLYQRGASGWEPRALPAPAYSVASAMKAKSVRVRSADDVSVIAQYWESGLGWKERELHTAWLRSSPVEETLRCNEPDPENNNLQTGKGFQSWPDLASDHCAAPFVVLSRRSKAAKDKPTDWPKLRAAFKGHQELGSVELVEFVSGDRRFVGAKASNMENARKMVKLALAKDRVRPEIVCAEPPAERVLALDLATGTVR